MSKRLLHRTLLHSAALACLLSFAAVARAQQQPADERERGAALIKAGDYKAAARVLRAAVKKDKADAEAWHMLGASLARADDAKGARKAFETALKLRPDYAPARAGLAYALFLLRKHRDAVREADRALASDPQSSVALYVIGAVRYGESKFEEAAERAEAALRLDPTSPAVARLAAEALINFYTDESLRYARQHPPRPGADEAERKAAREAFARDFAPLKARLLETAERMEAILKERADLAEPDVWRELVETLRYYGRPPGQPVDGDAGALSLEQVTTKAVILMKPEPSFTEEARKNNTSGVVRVRAVLGADGRVGRILVLRRLPDGLTQKAVSAARGIKFTPATKDGKPVSQIVILEDNFHIY